MLTDRQKTICETHAVVMLKKDIGKMDQEHVKHLSGFYPALWHESAASMPDGWAEIIAEFFGDVANIGDMDDAVSCRFERTPSGLKVFCFPEMTKWTEQQHTALHEAQSMLYQLSQVTCEWCGQPGGQVQIGDRASFFLCEEDGASAREKLSAQVKAFDERVRFRGEVSMLFQEHSNVWLRCSDINMPILRKALRDIKRIVEERDLVGKVYVTKIMESEGQLFISARCDQADPASQFEIADIIKNAEWESDQLQLEANKTDMSDDA